MEGLRIVLRRRVALPLMSHHMDDYGAVQTFGVMKRMDHLINIMSVHRTELRQSHIFEEHPRNKELLQAALRIADTAHQPLAHTRNPGKRRGDIFL